MHNALLTALVPLVALQAVPQATTPPVFRAETTLALVPFHVLQKGRYVDSITPDDIVLLENGTPRPIALFEGGRVTRRTVPVELAVVFDVSGTITHPGLLEPLAYQSSLLDGFGDARLAVYAFDTRLRRFCRPTRDSSELARALERLRDGKSLETPEADDIVLELPPKKSAQREGKSWIYEAILAVARDVASDAPRATQMIVPFSDGFSTTSTRPEDITSTLRELGIAVFPVVLGHTYLIEQMSTAEYNMTTPGLASVRGQEGLFAIHAKELQMQEFAALGEQTGGRSFDPRTVNLTMIRAILGAVVAAMRSEFVVGYLPEPSSPRSKRKLEIQLRSKKIGKLTGGTRTIVY
jgi:VWFA-related protein